MHGATMTRMRTASLPQVRRQRLATQRLSAAGLRRGGDVVRLLAAIQSQDAPLAAWSLAMRMPAGTTYAGLLAEQSVRRLGAHPRAAAHMALRRTRGPALDAARHGAARRVLARGAPPRAGAGRRVHDAGLPGARAGARRADPAHPTRAASGLRGRRPAHGRRAPRPPADPRRAALAHLLRAPARRRAHLRPRRRDRATRPARPPRRRGRPARADATLHLGARPGIRPGPGTLVHPHSRA